MACGRIHQQKAPVPLDGWTGAGCLRNPRSPRRSGCASAEPYPSRRARTVNTTILKTNPQDHLSTGMNFRKRSAARSRPGTPRRPSVGEIGRACFPARRNGNVKVGGMIGFIPVRIAGGAAGATRPAHAGKTPPMHANPHPGLFDQTDTHHGLTNFAKNVAARLTHLTLLIAG